MEDAALKRQKWQGHAPSTLPNVPLVLPTQMNALSKQYTNGAVGDSGLPVLATGYDISVRASPSCGVVTCIHHVHGGVEGNHVCAPSAQSGIDCIPGLLLRRMRRRLSQGPEVRTATVAVTSQEVQQSLQ